jgi:hypothetical protein
MEIAQAFNDQRDTPVTWSFLPRSALSDMRDCHANTRQGHQSCHIVADV